MKKLLFVGLLMTSFFVMFSCTASKSGKTGDATEKVKKKNKFETDQDMPLAQYLRRVSGLRITGSGSSAKVRINAMGNSSLLNQEPLFVIDGVRMVSFAQADQMIQTSQVKKVRVLRTASETAFYGSAGANGVIVITTKKGNNK